MDFKGITMTSATKENPIAMRTFRTDQETWSDLKKIADLQGMTVGRYLERLVKKEILESRN